jgi:hypothetical protein
MYHDEMRVVPVPGLLSFLVMFLLLIAPHARFPDFVVGNGNDGTLELLFGCYKFINLSRRETDGPRQPPFESQYTEIVLGGESRKDPVHSR